MSILTQAEQGNKPEMIQRFFKEWRIGKLLHETGARKEKGVPALRLFEFLFLLVFQNTIPYEAFRQDKDCALGFAKDTVYRFLNATGINWEKFLLLLSAKVIRTRIAPLTSKARKRVFVLDDTVYERGRSKQVELLSRVFDHVTCRYKRGFQMLTLGWSDGNTFLPLGFRMMGSAKEKNVYCPQRDDLDSRTLAARRRKQAISGKPACVIDMLKRAIAAGVEASHVLFDSWFATPDMIHKIVALGLDAVTMLKATNWCCYRYGGKQISLEALYRKTAGSHGRLYDVPIRFASKEGSVIPARVVFVKCNNKRGWLALLSTDVSMSDQEIIQLYGKRWEIEVFFKACKSSLSLEKELQTRDYDAIVAHATIVCCRYIMLTVQARLDEDIRSWGDLMYLCFEELEDISFQQSLQLVLEEIISGISSAFSLALADVKNAILMCLKPAHPLGFAHVRVCES